MLPAAKAAAAAAAAVRTAAAKPLPAAAAAPAAAAPLWLHEPLVCILSCSSRCRPCCCYWGSKCGYELYRHPVSWSRAAAACISTSRPITAAAAAEAAAKPIAAAERFIPNPSAAEAAAAAAAGAAGAAAGAAGTGSSAVCLAASSASRVRNIALMAHVDAGKTTTGESLLLLGDQLTAKGAVDEGTAALDFLRQVNPKP